jgi:hypothetical protein
MHTSIKRLPAGVGIVSALALLLQLIIPSAEVAAASGITFILYMGGTCVGGQAGPANKPVHVEWRDASAHPKAQADSTTDQYGSWSLCAEDSTFVAIGDVVSVRLATAHRTFVVPQLSLNLDRVQNLIRGTGPAGSTLALEWEYFSYDIIQDQDVHVGSNGKWSLNPDSDANDLVAWLSWRPNGGDVVYIEDTYAPELKAGLNGRFSGVGGHRQQITVKVLDPDTGRERGSGVATGDYYGRFAGVIRDAQGHRLEVRPGDRVVARDLAPDTDFIMPRITASADVAHDVVTGRCAPTVTFAFAAGASVWRAPGHERGTTHGGQTDLRGRFSIDTSTGDALTSSPANIKRGDRIKVDCAMLAGDAASFTFVAR